MELTIALFNAHSVIIKKKKKSGNSNILDWFWRWSSLSHGNVAEDERRWSEVYHGDTAWSPSPCSSWGGGLAVIFKGYLSSRMISFTSSFPFDHSSFELAQVSLTLPQQNIPFFCLYQIPFTPQVARINSPTPCFLTSFLIYLTTVILSHDPLIILSDFSVHYSSPPKLQHGENNGSPLPVPALM